jgi:hypothetical protein
MVLSVGLQTRERWEDQVKRMRAAGIDLPDVDHEQVRDFHLRGQYDFISRKGHHLGREFKVLNRILPNFFARKWTVLRAAKDSQGFITSDQPVCLTWTNPSERDDRIPPGFGMKSTDVFFPVSRQTALVGRFGGDEQVLAADIFDVSACNGIVIQLSRRQVYAANDSFLYRIGTLADIKEGRHLIQDVTVLRDSA